MAFNSPDTVVTAEVARASLVAAGIHPLWIDRVLHGLRYVEADGRGQSITGLSVEADNRDGLARFEMRCGRVAHTFTRAENQKRYNGTEIGASTWVHVSHGVATA